MAGRHRSRRAASRFGWFGIAAIVLAVSLLALRWLRDGAAPDDGVRAGGPSSSAPTPAAPSPAPSPSASPTPEARRRLVIHATGDVNLDPSYVTTFRVEGYGYAWSGLGGLFKEDDLTIVNLECAVTDGGVPRVKEFVFRGDPAALPAMRRAGVEVANLGNNHSLDYGVEGMLDTRRNLRDAGIAPVGAGKDAAQANAPSLFQIKGWRVAVLGFGGVFSTVTDAATRDRAGFADGDDIESMVRAVKRADRVADLVIVMVHWGVELETSPRQEDVERAEAMIRAGADMIFGGHPHRLQPMIPYRQRPVFYSLGNFVWPNFSVAGSTTAVAEVLVHPDGKITARLLPAFIESAGHPVLRG